MDRPFLLLVLPATLLLCGCATPQSVIPRGQDPDKLVEAITLTTRADGPVEPIPTDTSVLGTYLMVGGKVFAIVGILALQTLYLKVLDEIWSK